MDPCIGIGPHHSNTVCSFPDKPKLKALETVAKIMTNQYFSPRTIINWQIYSKFKFRHKVLHMSSVHNYRRESTMLNYNRDFLFTHKY